MLIIGLEKGLAIFLTFTVLLLLTRVICHTALYDSQVELLFNYYCVKNKNKPTTEIIVRPFTQSKCRRGDTFTLITKIKYSAQAFVNKIHFIKHVIEKIVMHVPKWSWQRSLQAYHLRGAEGWFQSVGGGVKYLTSGVIWFECSTHPPIISKINLKSSKTIPQKHHFGDNK